jgi:hypothetical protein
VGLGVSVGVGVGVGVHGRVVSGTALGEGVAHTNDDGDVGGWVVEDFTTLLLFLVVSLFCLP